MRWTATFLTAFAVTFVAVAAPVRTATETFVTNRIATAVAALPAPDYSTNNAALIETIQATTPPETDPHFSKWAATNTVLDDAKSYADGVAGNISRRPMTHTGPTGYYSDDGERFVIDDAQSGANRAVFTNATSPSIALDFEYDGFLVARPIVGSKFIYRLVADGVTVDAVTNTVVAGHKYTLTPDSIGLGDYGDLRYRVAGVEYYATIVYSDDLAAERSRTAQSMSAYLTAESDPAFAAWLATNAPATPEPQPVGIYAYPGDWQLAVTDAGSTNGSGTTTAAKRDYLSLIAGTTGLYRRYRVEAVPEQAIIPSGSTLQPVDFSVYDPQGCVADFTDGVIGASGTPGLAMVTGTDTTGVSRTASVAMTPVAQGSTITEMYAESALAERYIWNTNILAKIAAVSTAAADMVDYRWCRHQDNWTQGAPADGHRFIPRALSRWGSDGRLNDSEWTWGGSGANKARFSPNVANSDFFWPELLPGLQCFSARAHETTASDNPSQCYPYIAVAPHYIVTAGHYSSAWWVGMRWVVQPYFCTDLAARTFLTAGCDRLVGKIPRGDGVVADMMLIRTSTAIPSNCLARFATDATLEQLSKSKFGKCVALTVTAHQTIAPLCLNATQSGSVYSWTGEPIVSTSREPYLVNAGDTAKAMALEHPVHMFDSGDPIFLASPSGKVVPVSIFCTSNGRSGSGPRFGDLLDSLSSMIRADSGGTEDIQYWSRADLWSGVGVNDLE